MTTYNAYELNYNIDELKKMTTEEMTDITLLSDQSEQYQALAEGDKKALQHLVASAKILNNVSLQQDNPHNISLKKALEKEAANDEQAALSLKMFNSLNGVCGLNGIDEKPITIFKGLTTPAGKNFYPQDLSINEFHQILLKMFSEGKDREIAKILSARTMVVREQDELKAIDYTEYFKQEFSEMANELEVAAHYCTNDLFKEYLSLTRNTSIMAYCSVKTCRKALDIKMEYPRCLAKPLPLPRDTTAKAMSLPHNALPTSLTVPSPPTATIWVYLPEIRAASTNLRA